MNIQPLAKQIFDDILKHNGEVYIVGGSVRDTFLRVKESHDFDVEVYHLEYEELYDILKKYGHVNTFGKSFAIMQLDTLKEYDFALPRKEIKTGNKHVDFKVDVDPFLPKEKAVMRRDFTMNALMYDYKNDCIIDLVEGIKDIQDEMIRCVNPDSFVEDPLRVLRLARFIAKFEMKVDESTKELCKQMVKDHKLDYLSKERVYEEYTKILMTSKPSLGFDFLREIDALPYYLKDLISTNQRLDFHPEGSVYNHTMLVVDIAALLKDKIDEPESFMWSCLLHDIGKPAVTTEKGSAPLHNEAGVELFKKIDLIQSKKQRQYISTMIMYHMHLMNMLRFQSEDYKYLRILKKIENKISLNDLMWISCCDKLGRGRVVYEQYHDFWDYMNDKINRLGTSPIEPIINGYDLINEGFIQDKNLKVLLEEAYDLQLQGMNKEKIIRSLKDKYE